MLTAPEPNLPSWTFLTNHAHVLIAISRNPDARQKDVAFVVGITVGAAQRIIADLEREGYISHDRLGRRNHYRVVADKLLRHPLENQHSVGELITSLDQ